MSSWHKKRTVIHRYDTTAHLYDTRYLEEQVAKITAGLRHLDDKELGVVLDLGCGTGILIDELKDMAVEIVGADISRRTLLEARKRTENAHRAHLVLADADNTPFKENVFDSVFAVTLLQNMPDPHLTLKEMKRVSKAKAVFVVTGLKRVFSLESLKRLLKREDLAVLALEAEGLRCHIAVCKKMQ